MYVSLNKLLDIWEEQLAKRNPPWTRDELILALEIYFRVSPLHTSEKHPEIVDKFLKGVIEGIAFFKTHREESIKIIENKYKAEGELNHEEATHLYEEIANILEPKLYASIKAVCNVYELAVRQDKAAEKIEPTSLWDYHYLRRIDDSGFIDALYKN